MILEFTPSDVTPEKAAVFRTLGIPDDVTVPDHIERLYVDGLRLLEQTVRPVGIVADISTEKFATVFCGEGLNDPDSVVGKVFPNAEHLALFAVTLGDQTPTAIAEGFESKDFALASMLDALASESADLAAEMAERWFEQHLRDGGWGEADGGVLRYSPGYCGWNITGQRQLFSHLDPARIGLTLTESCLMVPLKSVSGVIIAGPKAIHRFKPTYSFCSTCETHACRERMLALKHR